MDDKDLKITALKQRIGELTSQYEEKVADLRVIITQQENALNANATPQAEDVVEGEVV